MPCQQTKGIFRQIINSFLKIIGSRVFKILIVALIIYIFFKSGKLDIVRLYASIKKIDLLYGVLLLGILPFLFSIRWLLLLDVQNVSLPFSGVCQLTFIALFFDTILPPGGADIARGYYLNKSLPNLDNKIAAYSSILFDRIIGLFSLLIIGIIGLFINIEFFISQDILGNTLLYLLIIFIVFLSIIILSICFEKYRTKIVNYLSNNTHIAYIIHISTFLKAYKENLRYILYVFLISCIGHILTFLAIFLFAQALGEASLTFSDYMGILPISFLVTQIPIGPGFIGVGLLSFYSFFKIAGSNYGSDIFALYLCIRILTTLPGGYFYIFFKHGADSSSMESVPVSEEELYH
jgi:uncharacterized protein (TIRG00374 family)